MLESLNRLYSDWNTRLNLISRKDMDNFTLHHIIHSLAISRFISFKAGTNVLDAGTGGGFPGIPLAIVFPECNFILADSVRKKINAVDDIKNRLGLVNVSTAWNRIEDMPGEVDFVVSRAVAPFEALFKWTSGKISRQSFNNMPNGLIILKGGDLKDELIKFPRCIILNLNEYFEEEYFSEKKIVYMPASEKRQTTKG